MRRVDRSLLLLNPDARLPIGNVRGEKAVADEQGRRLAE